MGRVKKKNSEPAHTRKQGSALLPDYGTSGSSTPQNQPDGLLKRIRLDEIDTTANPRKEFPNIDQLAASIRILGLLNPITVGPPDASSGLYPLIGGGRRIKAFEKLNWLEIDAIIKREKDIQTDLHNPARIVDNLQRNGLSPIEEAESIRLLKDTYKVGEIAKLLSKSPAWVTQKIRHAELYCIDPAAEDLDFTTAYEIYKTTEDDSLRKEMIKEALNSGIRPRDFVDAKKKVAEKAKHGTQNPVVDLIRRDIERLAKRIQRIEVKKASDASRARDYVDQLRKIANHLNKRASSF